MAEFADLALFRQVPVVPVSKVHQHVALGGPIWPGFATRTVVRHCRNNHPWDHEPALPDAMTALDQPAVWGGFLDSHFGHFVADHLPRLPVSLLKRPEDLYLFTVDPGMTRDGLAGWVWQVFDWIGLARDQVRIVTEPLLVAELRVGRQAEMLPQVGPRAGYLDLIDRWFYQLDPVRVPVLYVARAGMAARGGGAHAGEDYLVTLLRRLGVAVLDPAMATVPEQLASYAGARHLIFAEGSALHGRQLIGRVAQDISVIRRRDDTRMAEAMLAPRCRKLSYLDVGSDRLMTYWKTGAKRPDPALCLYDVARLQDAFRGWGLDLAAAWDAAAFRRAEAADVAAWLAFWQPDAARMAEYHSVLARAGASL
ncbi:MAG: glycosyltransferase 61 family protein [bacterium]